MYEEKSIVSRLISSMIFSKFSEKIKLTEVVISLCQSDFKTDNRRFPDAISKSYF